MGFTLSEETQKLIEERMKEGGFSSADELIQAVLGGEGVMDVGTLDEETLDAIDRAEEQIRRGEYRELEDVRREWRERPGG